MEITNVKFDKEVSKGILNGAEKVFKTVAYTMGRMGGYTGIQSRLEKNYITKDGFYSANTIILEDEVENFGASMMKEVAFKQSNEVGDGTTTVTVLTYNLYKRAIKGIQKGFNANEIAKGMKDASVLVNAEILTLTKPIAGDDIKKIAIISANNNEEVGEVVAEAMSKIKDEGKIKLENGMSNSTSIKVVDGMTIDSGYNSTSNYFINTESDMTVDFGDTFIMIYDDKISTLKDIEPVLKFISEVGKALLIIAIDVEQEALATLVTNKVRGGMKLAAINIHGYGAVKDTFLKDVAISCGAYVISQKAGESIASFTPEMLGTAKRVVITATETTIIEGGYDEKDKESHIESIRTQIEKSKHEASTMHHKDRLARIDGGVAIITIGANTEVEQRELKDLYEDAVGATKAAKEMGVVPGGGSALIHSSKVLDTEMEGSDSYLFGVKIVRESLAEPLMTIMDNAVLDKNEIAATIRESKSNTIGYDLAHDEYCDMIDSGIIDPAKVTISALDNAVSISTMMFRTKTIIHTKNNKD